MSTAFWFKQKISNPIPLLAFMVISLVTDRIRSMAEGTVFTGVCHSLCPQAGFWSGGGVTREGGMTRGWYDQERWFDQGDMTRDVTRGWYDQGGSVTMGLGPWGGVTRRGVTRGCVQGCRQRRTPPPRQRTTPHAPAPNTGNTGIWSMRGRYASYWNAFLLSLANWLHCLTDGYGFGE